MRFVAFALSVALAGCSVSTASAPPPQPTAAPAPATKRSLVSEQVAYARLERVVLRVEPVAEKICRDNTTGVDCNLNIFIDEDETRISNAYQTLDRQGRPVIVFTMLLAQEAQNDDELAFILGHEAAHHIRGHIPQSQTTAAFGGILAGVLASAAGAPARTTGALQELGGVVGSRRFSKVFELEADELGAIIAARAGYDPLKGAEFFNRIPDPGDVFLGTHPPNAERIETVRRTAAQL